jgi:hypothetical protein
MFQVGYDVFVPDNIIERVRSVFLGPDHLFHNLGIAGRDIKIIGMAGWGATWVSAPVEAPLTIASSRLGLADPMPSAVTVPGGTPARSISTARSSSVHALPQRAKSPPRVGPS